jgi:translation elongation factor P/translation initiation factor 5A
LAGFQVIINGRFWVITEAQRFHEARNETAAALHALKVFESKSTLQ